MAEYIKRDTLIEAIKAQFEGRPISEMDKMWNAALSCAIGQVESEPSADVVERKKGKWIYQFHEDEVGVTCSECEGYAESFARWLYDDGYRIDYNYCPNCGAFMGGEDDV